MKRQSEIIISHLTIISLLFFLNSCSEYNFSRPQPVDRENIYLFPEEFQGTWMNAADANNYSSSNAASDGNNLPMLSAFGDEVATPANTETIAKKNIPAEYSHDIYLITENHFFFITHGEEKIVKGYWPKRDINGDLVYPPYFNSLNTIIRDSSGKPKDTVDNYLVHNGKIYEIMGEARLGNGYDYVLDADTIIVKKSDTICIDLGQNAFLRKLNDDCYTLNIRRSVIGEESSWWWVMVLEKGNGRIRVWDCSSKSDELPSMFFSRSAKADIFYFDSNWSSADILGLMKQGYFEITSTLQRKSN